MALIATALLGAQRLAARACLALAAALVAVELVGWAWRSHAVPLVAPVRTAVSLCVAWTASSVVARLTAVAFGTGLAAISLAAVAAVFFEAKVAQRARRKEIGSDGLDRCVEAPVQRLNKTSRYHRTVISSGAE